MASRIAVAIPAFNGIKPLTVCLDALARQTYREYELFVLDDASSDDTFNFLHKRRTQLTALWKNPINKGFTGACNELIRRLRKDFSYVVLLNQDAIPHTNWLCELLAAQSETDWAMVGSNVRDDRHRTDVSFTCRPIWFVPQWGALVNGELTSKNTATNFVAGTACLLKIDYLPDQEHVFDERLFMYHEDVDLSIRLCGLGRRIGIAPRALVWHDNSVDEWVVYYVIRNLHWIICKNFGFRFYARFFHRTFEWSRIASSHIAPKGHRGRVLRATRDAILGLPKFIQESLDPHAQELFESATPEAVREEVQRKIRTGAISDFIFHA